MIYRIADLGSTGVGAAPQIKDDAPTPQSGYTGTPPAPNLGHRWRCSKGMSNGVTHPR